MGELLQFNFTGVSMFYDQLPVIFLVRLVCSLGFPVENVLQLKKQLKIQCHLVRTLSNADMVIFDPEASQV